jgi:hypothetical protein
MRRSFFLFIGCLSSPVPYLTAKGAAPSEALFTIKGKRRLFPKTNGGQFAHPTWRLREVRYSSLFTEHDPMRTLRIIAKHIRFSVTVHISPRGFAAGMPTPTGLDLT